MTLTRLEKKIHMHLIQTPSGSDDSWVKLYLSERCGFFNCIAGAHHPSCSLAPGALKEIAYQDFVPWEDEMLQMMDEEGPLDF